MAADRSSLINELAAAMGAGQFSATAYENNRYDKGTGTLYCNGHIISATTIEKAKNFFEGNMKRCDRNTTAGNDMYMIYETAVEAIKWLQDSSPDNQGVVTKNDPPRGDKKH
jgi:hypothetical protein